MLSFTFSINNYYAFKTAFNFGHFDDVMTFKQSLVHFYFSKEKGWKFMKYKAS